MPNIVVRIPAGALDQKARAALVAAINQAAAECERIPPDPARRALCWVMIEEIAAGDLTCGGLDPLRALLPVMMTVNVPAGVLDDPSRARYAALMHEAVAAALPGQKRGILHHQRCRRRHLGRQWQHLALAADGSRLRLRAPATSRESNLTCRHAA